ncbi:PREDICTED: heparan-alpha-glucosaminide N-acetyltransferase-like isoform X5 [Nelumbo nucifera]|uniref:Heparan-alpha-glucosaminide N-acetyltransferase-like isoform X5 n=1 Tax=Nelumbo nucifera TaxID=4432 RepID=A0A1U8ASG8_NELNU|nr:PREDICTED: heparan-alpha-glucosaminide N-acetyltransferase-like isoform X5 [Nelumbo nucifera]
MADYVALLKDQGEAVEDEEPKVKRRSSRIASLDVFRGLSVFLMMLVDYAGPVLPSIGHSPWNGLHLADFVMPFFLFIAGFALALAYKNVTDRVLATHKAVLRAVKLFFLGIFLQGGYLHGTASLTFGVDIERIRWFGILQRISIGCIVAALCEIWFPCKIQREGRLFKGSYLHWCLAFALLTIYTGLLYGLYVPDWQFRLQRSTPSVLSSNDSDIIYRVKCAVRGDLGPACNSAGVIDRYVLGVDHLYRNPVYRKLKECNSSKSGQISDPSPSWCYAPFDPEGILSCCGLHHRTPLRPCPCTVRGPQESASSLDITFNFSVIPWFFADLSRNPPKQTSIYNQLSACYICFCRDNFLCSVFTVKRKRKVAILPIGTK